MKYTVVSATPLTTKEFWLNSKLGKSLTRQLDCHNIDSTKIYSENKKGLSFIYNNYLSIAEKDERVLFVHDDVSIEDIYLREKLDCAFLKYNVIGCAGAAYMGLTQPVLWHLQKREGLGGVVSHIFQHPQLGEYIDTKYFGPTPRQCLVIDGLFIGVDTSKLKDCKFDEQFVWHFYDLDFCINCSSKGITIGVWPIWVVHGSHGEFANKPEWHDAQSKFINKWGKK